MAEEKKHTWFPLITKAISGFKSEETPDEIREDLRKEWDLMEDFFKLYEKKTNNVKNTVNYWRSSSEKKIGDARKFIEDVYERINPELQEKIKKLLAGIVRIDRKLTVRIKRAYNLKDTKTREQLQELQRSITHYIKLIRNNLYFLKKLYRHQTGYIKDKGAGQIEGDLEKHSFLYRSLTDELRADRALKRNFIGFLRLIQTTLGIDRRSEEYLKKIPGEKIQEDLERYLNRAQDYVGGYRLEEILNPSSRELNEFYKLMGEFFPNQDMLDEMQIYRDALKLRFMRLNHKKWVNHIILLKKDNKIIGGALIDFAGCGLEKDLAIGILWFYLVPKEHFRQGFKMIIDFVERILDDDRKKLGYKELGGVFFEMEKKEFSTYKRLLELLGKIPARVNIRYEQPKLAENSKPVTKLNLYFYTMKDEWRSQIPVFDFAKMYRNFIMSMDCYWVWEGYEPEKDHSVLKVLKQLFRNVPKKFHQNPDYSKLMPKKQYVELIY